MGFDVETFSDNIMMIRSDIQGQKVNLMVKLIVQEISTQKMKNSEHFPQQTVLVSNC